MKDPYQQYAEQLFRTIDQSKEHIVGTLQQLVRFPTINPPGNEQAHQEFVAEQLHSLGVEPKFYEKERGRPNLLAILAGSGEGSNLLHYAGHADVISEGDPAAWKYPAFAGVVDAGWIHGRGAVDHKAPIAASLGALRAILENELRLGGDLLFLVPVDEERGSMAGTRYLIEQGVLYGDMGIYASAGFLEEVLVACSGTLSFEITVRGQRSHSGYPQRGVNAIEKASRLVLALQNMSFDKINPHWRPDENDRLKPTRTGSLTVAQIQGGEALNVVPGECVLSGSRRLIPTETLDEARGQIEAVVNELVAQDQEFHAEIVYTRGVHGINTPPDHPIVKIVQAAVRDIGLEPKIGGSSGGFDARWIVEALGIPFVSYGAGWNGPDGKLCLHAPNEAISIENLIGMTKAMAMIMVRSCGVVA